MEKEIWKVDSLILSIAILIGTVVGAGILGLPYAFSQVGFSVGFILTIFIFIAILGINLTVVELVLRAPGYNQLPGIAEKYVKNGRKIMLLLISIGMYGALIAYNIGIGTSLQNIFGGSWRCYTTLFFILSSIIVLRGIKSVGKTEIILTFLIIGIVIFLATSNLQYISKNNLNYINLNEIPSSYGVILFAFLGFSVVPQIEKVMKTNKKKIAYAVFIGLLICLTLYLFFSFSFVGRFGKEIKEVATESLNHPLNYIGLILAIIAMGSSSLILGTTLKDSLIDDFKYNKLTSWFLAYFTPYFISMLGLTSFTNILSITGKYSGGLTAIFVCYLLKKAREDNKKKVKFNLPGRNITLYLLSLFFIIGMILI